MDTPQAAQPPERIARAALLFGSGTLFSRIFGLLRDSLLISLMPLDMKDAWLAAFRIPNFFRRFLGEGGLSVSFIPIFVATQNQPQSQSQQKALKNGVFTLLMALATLICVVCFIFMDPIVRFMLSGKGFVDVPGKLELTIELSKIMIFFLFFICLFAYFMALLNSLKKFTLTGYAPIFLNLSIICALFYFRDDSRLSVASAWAVVVGGALQAFFLVPAIIKMKVIPVLTKDIFNPLVQKVLRKFLPTVFGVGILQILALINQYFASGLMSGAISYIYMADRLLELPLALVAVGIGTTLLPTLSSYWSLGKNDLFLQSVSRNLNLFFMLALPASFGFWMIGSDMIAVLFQRGEFTGKEVPIVADILKVYGLTLLSAGSQRVLSSAFYAIGDTLTPALVSAGGLLLHVLMAPYWIKAYDLNGLVISTCIITFVNLIVCLFLIQKKVGLLKWQLMIDQFWRCLLACLAMSLPLLLSQNFGWRQNRFIFDFPVLLLIIGFSGIFYFGAAQWLNVADIVVLRKKIFKR